MPSQPLSLTGTMYYVLMWLHTNYSPFTLVDLEQPVVTVSSNPTSWAPDTPIIIGQSDTPSEVILNCSVDAHPIPRLTWTRRNGVIIQEVSIYMIVYKFSNPYTEW